MPPLSVRSAATVVCARLRAPPPSPLLLSSLKRGPERPGSDDRVGALFSRGSSAHLRRGWELLLGQGEVRNHLRSSACSVGRMRYPGEFKFAGGAVDGGESLLGCAVRELEEEFLTPVPSDARLRLLSVKQTRPVGGRSYVMHNFVCLEEENEWLRELDVGDVNRRLGERRGAFDELLERGEFWDMGKEEKAAVSPEVRKVEWLPLQTAVAHCFSSMNSVLTPVNAFQEAEFRELGIEERDPLFITMLVMLELEELGGLREVVEFTDGMDVEEERRRVVWLEDGMEEGEVSCNRKRRVQPQP